MAPELMNVNNKPHISQWSLENGYEDAVDRNSYPIRVFNARQGAALVTYMRLFEKDQEYLCRGSNQGFKLVLTTPGEIFKRSRMVYKLPPNKETEVSIRPRLMVTSPELRFVLFFNYVYRYSDT